MLGRGQRGPLDFVCHSLLATHPRLPRALVSNLGLALFLAGCVAQANYFPFLGPSPALGGSSACLGSVRWEVAVLCQCRKEVWVCWKV